MAYTSRSPQPNTKNIILHVRWDSFILFYFILDSFIFKSVTVKTFIKMIHKLWSLCNNNWKLLINKWLFEFTGRFTDSFKVYPDEPPLQMRSATIARLLGIGYVLLLGISEYNMYRLSFSQTIPSVLVASKINIIGMTYNTRVGPYIPIIITKTMTTPRESQL